jgi:hypothetical protein
LKWDEVLKDLEGRRDAMVDGEEWDVRFQDGKIVWQKPSMEKLKQSLQQHEEFRKWGAGWRKWIVWSLWRIMGSPEGVFETEDGKIDGRLVLRQLREEKVKTSVTGTEAKKGEEKKP